MVVVSKENKCQKYLTKLLKSVEEIELPTKLFLSEIFVKSYEDIFLADQVKKKLQKKFIGVYTYILLS